MTTFRQAELVDPLHHRIALTYTLPDGDDETLIHCGCGWHAVLWPGFFTDPETSKPEWLRQAHDRMAHT